MNLSLSEIEAMLEAEGYSWRSESIAMAEKPRYWRFDVWRWEPRAHEFAVSEMGELKAALEVYEKIMGGNEK